MTTSTSLQIQMEGVQHLHGNLYRVRPSLIQFAEGDEEDSLTFRNPRYALSRDGKNPKGMSASEMSELREAIRTEGLENPPVLRYLVIGEEEILQLVSGERRTRSILRLIKDNAMCYDPATQQMVPAQELYEYVDVRINDMDDQTAYKHAFSGNDKAIGIGDGATICLVRDFRQNGWTDQQIMNATGKSITWLKDTDTLINLDDQCFTALAEEHINRSAALELAKIEDVEERLQLLDSAMLFATKRLKTMKEKLEREVQKAEEKLEIAETEAALAEDDATAVEFEADAQELAEKLEAKRQASKELEEEEACITGKDLGHARIERRRKNPGANPGGLSDGNLTRAKIQKFWYEPCKEIIANDGCDKDGTPVEADLEDVYLVQLLCEKMEKGDRDIISILAQHQKNKDRRSS